MIIMALWAKIDNDTGEVINIECADADWVDAQAASASVVDYHYREFAEDARDRPGPGWLWDSDLQRFRRPQPYPSWLYDMDSYGWVPPVPMPDTEGSWVWNEDAGEWTDNTPVPE